MELNPLSPQEFQEFMGFVSENYDEISEHYPAYKDLKDQPSLLGSKFVYSFYGWVGISAPVRAFKLPHLRLLFPKIVQDKIDEKFQPSPLAPEKQST